MKLEEKQNQQIRTWRKDNTIEDENFSNLLLINSQENQIGNSEPREIINEKPNKITSTEEPTPSTSGINTKALRQYPGSRRNLLGRIMKLHPHRLPAVRNGTWKNHGRCRSCIP